jgi:hypothetical protein
MEGAMEISLRAILGGGENVVVCPRCGVLGRTREDGAAEADIARYASQEVAERGAALCGGCIATEFIQSVETLMWGLEKQGGPSALLKPQIQQAFAGLINTARGDLRTEAIDWRAVVEHWDKPFPKAKRRRRK